MIAVTGATGHVGSAIVRTLRQHDLPVRALVRKGSEYYWLNDTGCGFFFGDLRDPSSLRRALRDVEFVIAATNVQRESQDNNHRNVTVEGNQALFEAAKSRGVGRVVLISCMGADLDPPAFQARRGAEEALVASGVPYTILRSCIHERPFLEMAFRMADEGKIRLPGPGDNTLSVIPAVDLANMAAASLDLSSVENAIVPIGGTEAITARGAVELAAEVLGLTPNIGVLPDPIARIGSKMRKPFRRFANRLAETRVWFSTELTVPASGTVAAYGLPTTSLRDAMIATGTVMADLRDPERRDARIVHPQFYATVYEPGTADLADLPDGPLPRQD
jgi:uncharacterized protein YbjT (DUF2867 family)